MGYNWLEIVNFRRIISNTVYLSKLRTLRDEVRASKKDF